MDKIKRWACPVCGKISHDVEDTDRGGFCSSCDEFRPGGIRSVAIDRLIEEVRREAGTARSYNRTYNRHNRS